MLRLERCSASIFSRLDSQGAKNGKSDRALRYSMHPSIREQAIQPSTGVVNLEEHGADCLRSERKRWDPYMKLTVKLTPPLKLWKDRSRLYRRRFLQPRPHFSAFFENCTIYTPSHRSNLKIFKISHNISVKFSRFLNHFLQNSVDTSSNLLFFAEIFTDFCRNFTECQKF